MKHRTHQHQVVFPRLVLSLVLLVLLWAFNLAPAWAIGVSDFPDVQAGDSTWVVDQADILSRANEGKLINTLQKLAQNTNQEVRFVTLRHLDYGETIDSLTNGLFERWFPTPEAQANQGIIVLDTVTNNIGIRTGEAVAASFPPGLTESLLNDTMGIPIRDGNKYNEAILGASDRVAAVLSGEEDPGIPQAKDDLNVEGTFASAEDTDDRSATVWVVVLLVVATVIPMATYYFYQGFSG
jgi:uncharacterized protein